MWQKRPVGLRRLGALAGIVFLLGACVGGAAEAQQQFQVAVSTQATPTCAIGSPGFVANGSFTVAVTDDPACVGTYTVNAAPVANSAPDGTTPPLTTVVTYIGFPQGSFFFGNAGPGQYTVTTTNTQAACSPVTNPVVITVTVPDGATGGICNVPPTQFTASATTVMAPTCALSTPGYTTDGSFTITVADGSGCTGTYTVNAAPVANSAPGGTTPPLTTVTTYIGFPQGSFFFGNAGPGQYTVTTTDTSGKCPLMNPTVLVVTVPDGATGGACDTQNPNQFFATATDIISPTCPFTSTNHTADGSFTARVTDGANCSGIYTVNAAPVANSAPDGTTPPLTTVTTYIGFPQGSLFFANAGVGQYKVTTTDTSGNCDQAAAVRVFTVQVPDRVAQHTVTVLSVIDSLAGTNGTGSIQLLVQDAIAACPGTYTITALPVPGSGPGGSTPPPPPIDTFTGLPQGEVAFTQVSEGQYRITVLETGGLNPPVNPVEVTVTVDGTRPVPVLSPLGLVIASAILFAFGAVALKRTRRGVGVTRN